MQVGAYINLVCDADEQKAVNLARTGAGLVSHFAGMKAASTDHLPPQIKDIAENLKTQYDMAHHAQEKGSHLGMIDDEYVRWMAICGTPSLCIDKLSVLLDMGLQHIYLLGGTPYEGPPNWRTRRIRCLVCLPYNRARNHDVRPSPHRAQTYLPLVVELSTERLVHPPWLRTETTRERERRVFHPTCL